MKEVAVVLVLIIVFIFCYALCGANNNSKDRERDDEEFIKYMEKKAAKDDYNYKCNKEFKKIINKRFTKVK